MQWAEIQPIDSPGKAKEYLNHTLLGHWRLDRHSFEQGARFGLGVGPADLARGPPAGKGAELLHFLQFSHRFLWVAPIAKALGANGFAEVQGLRDRHPSQGRGFCGWGDR